MISVSYTHLGDSIAVTLDDGETYAAELIGTDVKSDIAVLKIDAQNLPAAEFGDSSQVDVGEAAIAIGNPLGLNGTVTAGIISAVDREIQVGSSNMVLLQTDASINPGNSGGALLNEYGQDVYKRQSPMCSSSLRSTPSARWPWRATPLPATSKALSITA